MTNSRIAAARRLAGCNGLLLLLTVGWSIAGSPVSCFRVRGLSDEARQFWLLVTMIRWTAIAGMIAYSVIRRQRRLAAYGLSFKSGGVASLAMASAAG